MNPEPIKVDPTYQPTASAIATDRDLAARPLRRFIAGGAGETMWHLGLRKENRGVRSGLIHAIFYVTACSGRQLGGPWGQTEVDTLPAGASLCPRCAKKLAALTPSDKQP